MKLQSWNRFKTRALAVEPALMGSAISFLHAGLHVAVKIPPLSSVGDQHDEDALATRGAWNGKSGEVLHYHVRMVDVVTQCSSEHEVPEAVLGRRPNATDLINQETQASLHATAAAAEAIASSALYYWAALLRWVTGFHPIYRETRIGSASGWQTYLHEVESDRPIWTTGGTFVIRLVHPITAEEWQRAQQLATEGKEPPMHAVLLGDAKHCIDVGDYRRALVDLSIACEVYLRALVISSLPSGVHEEVARVIEEANINQFISHLFPALLTEDARLEYKKTIKDELSSLLSRRNKLMHLGAVHGATEENCERYLRAVSALFRLNLCGKA